MKIPVLAIVFVIFTATLPVSANADDHVIRLATTTSTENSGLLQHLLRPFEAKYPYKVHVIAVGTGKALRMARQGDADLVLAHAPRLEDLFLAEGFGVNRRSVMENDFVIVGPSGDPAGIAVLSDVDEVFRAIAKTRSTFVSRGDRSGTHVKELSIWEMTDHAPEGDWYRNAGQGMGMVLNMADQLGGYTLTDRGTWLAYRRRLDLKLLFSGGTILRNPYSIIAVNPASHPDINYIGAMTLIAWLTSPAGQALINNYKVKGERLFTATADPGLIQGD